MATRRLEIKFTGDTKGLDKASRQGRQQVDGWKDTFSRWNRRAVVASTAIVAGAARAGKSLVDAGRDGLRAERALEQAFTSMGGAASDAFRGSAEAAAEMSRQIGQPATAINDVQTTLATFGNVWKDPVAGAENFNRTTKLAFDLEAAGFGAADSNIRQLGRAINDPVEGMTALTRAGVSFTEAEKDKVKQLQDSGDLLGAQELLLEKLETQVGGVAEASADAGTRMSAQWENLQDQIGRRLIPVFDQLIAIGSQVLDWAAENDTTLIVLGATLVGLATFVLAANAAWKIYIATTRAVTLATKAATAAQKALNLAMRANPIGLIITAIAALIAIVVAIERKTGFFSQLWSKAWGTIQDAVSTAFGWIKQNWPLVLAILTGPIGLAVLAITRNWDRITDGARSVKDGIVRFFSGLASTISAPFRAAFDAVRSAWNSTLGGKGFSAPSWLPGLGGREFRIPTLHGGGVFQPPDGRSEGLALLRRGERVATPGQSTGDEVNVTVMLSRRAIEGIAEVVVSRGNEELKRAVLTGSGTV